MTDSNTSLSYPTPSTGALGDSISPKVDPEDNTYIQVAESNEQNVRGILGRTSQFPPVKGARIREDPGGEITKPDDPRILQRTLRSGAEVDFVQLEELNPGSGPDVSFTIQHAPECKCKHGPKELIQREIANIGAVLTNEETDGNPLNNQAKMVGRVWKYFPDEDSPNQYIQYDLDGNKVYAPSSTYEDQGFQWTSLPNGNFGIMDDDPQHRLSLGESPCDDGSRFGASLGHYIKLDDGKDGVYLHAKNGHLYVNGARVLTEKPKRK